MKRKALWFGVALLVAATGYAVLVTATRGEYSAEELSEDRAIAAASWFLQTCQLPPVTGTQRARLRTGSDGWRFWDVAWPGQYTFRIDARNGQVYRFSNDAREYEQVKRIGRDRQPQIASREAAEQYCWQLAQRLGLPKGAYLKRLRMVAEGETSNGDANRAGTITAVFDVRYFGYSFLGESGEVVVTVDPIDGRLVYFGRRLDTLIESHDPRISQNDAVQKAKQVYANWYQTHRSPHQGQYTGRVEIGYVYPNGAFGGKRYPPQVPYRARLAYAVYFGKEAVWIDAADGSVLGGILLK
ncbi:MAG: hypothetical protein ACP5RN_02660 [Armatimonadota bacterium]